MLAVVDWGAVTLLGAFVVGATFGTVLTLRLAKILAQFFADQLRRREPPAP